MSSIFLDLPYETFPEYHEQIDGAVYLPTSGDEVQVLYLRDVEYACVNDVHLKLQILMPMSRNEPNKIFPCVVFIHGSAWEKQDLYIEVPNFSRLAKLGYVVAALEIRDSSFAYHPAQAIDARNAIRFMRLHSKEYRIDPEKVVVMGNSSGGHTALFAGIIHDDEEKTNLYPGVSGEAKGIISLYGALGNIPDNSFPTTSNHHLPDSPDGEVMGGADMRANPELRKKFSAECYIEKDTPIVPVLLAHGARDRMVSPILSVAVYNRMKECGKDVELYLIEKADHGDAAFFGDEMLRIENRFIQRVCET